MTETKPKYNWDDLAEKGNNYGEIRIVLNALETHCVGLSKAEIYTDKNTFKDDFKQDLENRLDKIFEESSLPESDNSSMKKEFLKNLKTALELIVLKKAYAQITFSQFHLHKFFEALDSFVNEIEIEITKEAVKIVTSDPSRIGLMEIIFGSKSYQFFRAGKVGINVENLKKKLKGLNDNSEVVKILIFCTIFLFLLISFINSPFDKEEKYSISFKHNTEIRLAPKIFYPHIKEINEIIFVFRNMEKASHLELNFDRAGDYLRDTHVYLVADDSVNIFEESGFEIYDGANPSNPNQNKKWDLDYTSKKKLPNYHSSNVSANNSLKKSG